MSTRHNGNPNDEVMIDKYAANPINLDATPGQFRTQKAAIDTQGL